MPTNFSARWERRALYLGNSGTWAATAQATLRYRETSGVVPYQTRTVIPPQGPLGSGLPYMNISDYQSGSSSVAFSTTMPMTDLTSRDMYALLFNGLRHSQGSDVDTWSPLSAAATGLVVWETEAQSWATVGVELDDDGTVTSAFVVDSAMPTSVTLTIPQNTPGDSGGVIELSADWIGADSARTTVVTKNSPVDDTADFLQTWGSTFKIGATAHPFVSASITITNGATINPTASGSTTPTGITMGPITANGTITMLADMTDTTGLPDILYTSLETIVQASKQLEFHFEIAGTQTFDLLVPAVILAQPTFSDVGGINAMTFNFGTGGDVEGAGALAPEVTTFGGTDQKSIFDKT